MVFQNGRLKFLLGTPGGPGQTLTLVQVLSHLVDLELDLPSSVAEPRWSMDHDGQPILEEGVPDAVIAELCDLGFAVQRAPAASPFFGSAGLIQMLSDGVLCGVADGRREACALGA